MQRAAINSNQVHPWLIPLKWESWETASGTPITTTTLSPQCWHPPVPGLTGGNVHRRRRRNNSLFSSSILKLPHCVAENDFAVICVQTVSKLPRKQENSIFFFRLQETHGSGNHPFVMSRHARRVPASDSASVLSPSKQLFVCLFMSQGQCTAS